MHALIVVAHHDPQSLTHSVATQVAHGVTESARDHSVEIADLYAEGFNPVFGPADHAVLLAAVVDVGLDAARAREVLGSDAFAQEVRERERFYNSQGIHSVPAVIVNDRHLISGGQPAEVFEQALRQIAAGS